jgi:hypothetical protein
MVATKSVSNKKVIFGLAATLAAFLFSFGYSLAHIGGIVGFLLAALDIGVGFVVIFIGYLPLVKLPVSTSPFVVDLTKLQADIDAGEAKLTPQDIAFIKQLLPLLESLIASKESAAVNKPKA